MPVPPASPRTDASLERVPAFEGATPSTLRSSSIRFARLAAASAGGFLLALAAAHALRADLDPTWRPISEYALGVHGWAMTLAFACWGLGPIAVAAAVHRAARTRGARAGLAVLVLGALGPLLAAAFPMDPLGTPLEAMSGRGMLHAGSAVLGDLLPVGALILTIALTRADDVWAAGRRPLRAAALVAFALLVGASVAMGAMMPENGELGPEVKVGWLMRAFAVAGNVWVAVAAWATLRAGSQTPPAGPRRARAS